MTESAVCITQINFTTKLKSILASSKITYKDLAEACDISYIFINLFINNKQSGNIRLFISISDCLNLPLSELLYFKNNNVYDRYVSIVSNNEMDYKTIVEKSVPQESCNLVPILQKASKSSLDIYFDYFIDYVKCVMTKNKITVTKLSQISKVSRSFLNDLLKKRFYPSIDIIESIVFSLHGEVYNYFNTKDRAQINVPKGFKKYYLEYPKVDSINKHNNLVTNSL